MSPRRLIGPRGLIGPASGAIVGHIASATLQEMYHQAAAARIADAQVGQTQYLCGVYTAAFQIMENKQTYAFPDNVYGIFMSRLERTATAGC